MLEPETEIDVYIGKFLNNRYLIKHLIGKGGMGRVYLAEDLAKGRMQVAVKILIMSLGDEKISQRFAREIFIGAQLGRKSKNIVRILSYGMTDDKIPFYAMEYLQGKNLKKIIKVQPLTTKTFLYICYQICLGLQYAHQGISFKGKVYPILHRDIKPENIFITQDAKKDEVVRILDFGIAKFLTERSGITLTDSFIGSLPYCSPEHMEGSKLLDVRSDIYSLGVLMFEMLTGKHPFPRQNNSFGSWYKAHHFQAPLAFEEVNSSVNIPLELQKLVLSCLAKDVSDRPQNISEILETFQLVKLEIVNSRTDNNSEIKPNLSSVQLVPVTSDSEKECLQKTWPKHKPIASIGFPSLLHSNQGVFPTFWAMLPQEEISQLIDQTHSTEFIAKMDIYPMLLWVTVLCNPQVPLTRWLSFFLDMKDARGAKIVKILADTGYYHLLFFALEAPTHCAHVMTLTLTASQRQQLTDWLVLNENSDALITSSQAKTLLKTEYKRLKLARQKKISVNPPMETKDFKSCLSNFLAIFLQKLPLR
ncbi:serine/threonine protein kinase [Nodularia sphaerocarpa]|uniref:serine/threonine protein kinase n=1 Tax=Nodularia sphaerocarpa TaxID=137816 RepID=UPI001EFBF295|nr:serine/threonine-protein kinase [Nodularia sphaerocarpa]MDB9375875.1 serine/threonine-protein kinase [Nodularia sphaerocarpa CS-585]MDB9379559.1 serine/threonine-protein kinase [Nodularia sphaerocarpa CS-585A2]ULP71808.1 Serine/threonine-protein kinase A [Nodularia sphaerocarpa UHCC 0038]